MIVIIIMIITTNPTAAFLFRFSLEQVLNNLEFIFSEYQVAVVIFVMVAKFFVISTFNSVYVYTAELYPTVIRYGVSQSNKLVALLMINWKSMFPFSRPIRVLAHSISHFSLPFSPRTVLATLIFTRLVAPWKVTHIPESGKFCWRNLESWALESRIQNCLGLHYIGRGSIITLHLAWKITNKRKAGVTFMLTIPVFGTNGGNKCQVLRNS